MFYLYIMWSVYSQPSFTIKMFSCFLNVCLFDKMSEIYYARTCILFKIRFHIVKKFEYYGLREVLA